MDFQRLNDDALWDVVEQGVSEQDRARYQELFRWDAQGELSPEERNELDTLGALIDGWMAQREAALTELARRGYTI